VADNSKFVPPKGMRDWLPQETLLRQKLIRLIESQYQLYGFQPIDTPVMENIEVLQGKGGGENEKLMFKVQKRGEEFLAVFNGGENKTDYDRWVDEITGNVSDLGLRFDMTVPLARYYGNHANDLPKPFRCYHIGPVWRADRPQKGRFREFYQCDIDIIGGVSNVYEVEILTATERTLSALNLGKFTIRISDKRFLPLLLTDMGVDQIVIPKVMSVLDKLHKQDDESIRNEIRELINNEMVFNSFNFFFMDSRFVESGWEKYEPKNITLKDEFKKIVSNIFDIRDGVKEINPNTVVCFDPLLVRGLDYYTGPIFEANISGYTFSVAGGGRYDGLIEKMGGPKGIPAVGISIGFERILTILMEKKNEILKTIQSRVYIVNKGQSEIDIQILAEMLRSEGIAVESGLEKKDVIKQLVAAQGSGLEYAITDFVPGAQTFKVRQLSNRQDTEMNAEQLKEVLSKLL